MGTIYPINVVLGKMLSYMERLPMSPEINLIKVSGDTLVTILMALFIATGSFAVIPEQLYMWLKTGLKTHGMNQ
ncbi:hypothetical protein A7975_11815 [Bacillus sp. FJAT-26390]|nr:hypothetical protein [Bacillus sp. FJAT-26390]OBZ13509.1 hypothetical protein A7975_11815 [Bacillus sp. FJAT-26390]